MRKKYKIIYADPPWTFKTYSDKGKGRSPEKHYKCEGISYLKELQVCDIADADSICIMWATFPMLPKAIELMEEWGFEYKTVAFTWAKLLKHCPKKLILKRSKSYLE